MVELKQLIAEPQIAEGPGGNTNTEKMRSNFGQILDSARREQQATEEELGSGDLQAERAAERRRLESRDRLEDRDSEELQQEAEPQDAESTSADKAVSEDEEDELVPYALGTLSQGPKELAGELAGAGQSDADGVDWAKWLRAVQRQTSTEGGRQNLEGQLPQEQTVPEQEVQGSRNVLDLLDASELADPELVVEQTPEVLLNRIQQAAATSGSVALSSSSGPAEVRPAAGSSRTCHIGARRYGGDASAAPAC